MVHLTYYLDVLSSWCAYCETNLDKLRDVFRAQIGYDWRIALVTEAGPKGYTRQQLSWFYRRSGSVTGIELDANWARGEHSTLAPNLAAEAARTLGCADDRVRRALERAAHFDAVPVYERAKAVEVAAAAGNLDPAKLAAAMDDPQTLQRIRKSGEEFASYRIDQRPAFVLRSDIGDMAILSGIWRYEPLETLVAGMLADEKKYAEFASSNEPMPA